MSIIMALICLVITIITLIVVLKENDLQKLFIPAIPAALCCCYIFIAVVFHYLKKHIEKILKDREEEFNQLYPEGTAPSQS